MTEEVYGIDTSADDAARIMIQFVRKDWIEMEPSLYSGKWFDYRFLNPVQATYVYAHEFLRFYRMCVSKNFDSLSAQYRTPIKVHELFAIPEGASKETVAKLKKRTSGIWRGRQYADAMGMPYNVYLEFAFHWTMRYWKQRTPPRATQMYTDLVTDRAEIAWTERQNAMLFFSALPQYKNTAYENASKVLADAGYDSKILKSQNQHHEWLFGQLADRHNDPALFARLIWEDGVLPADKVQERLGDTIFASVREFAERYPQHADYN